jgi:hypothetical protein
VFCDSVLSRASTCLLWYRSCDFETDEQLTQTHRSCQKQTMKECRNVLPQDFDLAIELDVAIDVDGMIDSDRTSVRLMVGETVCVYE